jgi:peptidyl-prolyl cis-trans isomerase SurA
VLRVNDRIMTLVDYEARKNERLSILRTADIPADQRQERIATAGRDVLEAAFGEMLLLSRADNLGIQPSPEAVSASIDRVKQQFGLDTQAEFERALAQSNLTIEALREQYRSTLAMQEVLSREVRSRISIDQEDLRRYYQSHPEEFQLPVRRKVREIVVLDSSSLSAEERRVLAGDIAARIGEGTLSEAEVEQQSERGLATEWIDLGWVQPGDLDPQLEAAMKSLTAGQVSDPVAARGGLHLLQVVELKETQLLEFGDVEEQIRGRVFGQRYDEELEKYMQELQVASFIVSKPPPEAADFQVSEQRRRVDPLEKLDPTLGKPTLRSPGSAPAGDDAATPDAAAADSGDAT